MLTFHKWFNQCPQTNKQMPLNKHNPIRSHIVINASSACSRNWTRDFCPYATQIHTHKAAKIPQVSRSRNYKKVRGHSQTPKTSETLVYIHTPCIF